MHKEEIRSTYGSTGAADTEMVQMSVGDYEALVSQVDLARAAAEHAAVVVSREKPLSASVKCGRILAALAFSGLVAAVIYLGIKAQETGSGEAVDPCEGEATGTHIFGVLKQLVMQVGSNSSEAYEHVRVLDCDDAQHVFPDFEQACVELETNGSSVRAILPGGAPSLCFSTINALLIGLKGIRFQGVELGKATVTSAINFFISSSHWLLAKATTTVEVVSPHLHDLAEKLPEAASVYQTATTYLNSMASAASSWWYGSESSSL